MSDIRFPAIDVADMTPEQRAVADEISAGPRGGVRGPFIALLHHPELAHRVQALGEHLRYGTGLAPDIVEMIILSVARIWTCQYEWYAHARIAREKTSLSPDIIEAISLGKVPAEMNKDQRVIYAFCQEALRATAVSDECYEQAVALIGRRGVLDVLALCGYYSMLAMMLNVAKIPLPDGHEAPLSAAQFTLG